MWKVMAKMSEIPHIQGGQCGNHFRTNFWVVVCAENGIDPNGCHEGNKDPKLEKINVNYNVANKSRYVHPIVLMDLKSGTMDIIKSGPVDVVSTFDEGEGKSNKDDVDKFINPNPPSCCFIDSSSSDKDQG